MIATASAPFKRLYHVSSLNDEAQDRFTNSYREAVTYYYDLKRTHRDAKLTEEVYDTPADYMALRGYERCLLS